MYFRLWFNVDAQLLNQNNNKIDKVQMNVRNAYYALTKLVNDKRKNNYPRKKRGTKNKKKIPFWYYLPMLMFKRQKTFHAYTVDRIYRGRIEIQSNKQWRNAFYFSSWTAQMHSHTVKHIRKRYQYTRWGTWSVSYKVNEREILFIQYSTVNVCIEEEKNETKTAESKNETQRERKEEQE